MQLLRIWHHLKPRWANINQIMKPSGHTTSSILVAPLSHSSTTSSSYLLETPLSYTNLLHLFQIPHFEPFHLNTTNANPNKRALKRWYQVNEVNQHLLNIPELTPWLGIRTNWWELFFSAPPFTSSTMWVKDIFRLIFFTFCWALFVGKRFALIYFPLFFTRLQFNVNTNLRLVETDL